LKDKILRYAQDDSRKTIFQLASCYSERSEESFLRSFVNA